MNAMLLLTLSLGQYPSPYAPGPPPNLYNRTQQPLSPYLNLLRGGNPGVNYFYGVRPGLPSGGQPGYQVGPQTMAGPGQFLPQATMPVDSGTVSPYEPGGREVVLRSPAHAVLYGNSFNGHGSFFSVYASTVNRGQPTPQRNGATGLGTASVKPPRR